MGARICLRAEVPWRPATGLRLWAALDSRLPPKPRKRMLVLGRGASGATRADRAARATDR